MSQREDREFFEKDAAGLPLDEAVLKVRKCLHGIIKAMSIAAAYLHGDNVAKPATAISVLLSSVPNHQCRDFEDLCVCVKECPPGTINHKKVETVLELGKFLASCAEELLPEDDLSCHDLRDAMTMLYSTATNSSSRMPKDEYIMRVDETHKSICKAFKSLSAAFYKLERQRERGAQKSSSNGVLTNADRQFIDTSTRTAATEAAKAVIADNQKNAAETNSTLNVQREQLNHIDHQLELTRKGNGQIATRRFSEHEQETAFNLWVEASAQYGEKRIRDNGFEHCKLRLEKIRINDYKTWNRVKEQWRRKKNLSIEKAVMSYDSGL